VDASRDARAGARAEEPSAALPAVPQMRSGLRRLGLARRERLGEQRQVDAHRRNVRLRRRSLQAPSACVPAPAADLLVDEGLDRPHR